ncbi:MAG: GntR family transcriptional regulator [Pseudonocardiaceae bacterium]
MATPAASLKELINNLVQGSGLWVAASPWALLAAAISVAMGGRLGLRPPKAWWVFASRRLARYGVLLPGILLPMPELWGPAFPYHRIVDDLRSAIIAGLAPGERLSSEWELAQRYQTSRPTVRRAVAVLKAEGLVVTEQGRGTFVRPAPRVRLVVTGANYRRHRGAGVPGFNAQVTEYDTEGVPLEVQDSVAAADRHEFRYEVDMR